MRLFGLITYSLSQISHKQSHFESLRQYYFGKPYICLGVQSHPEDQGDFGQDLTVHISECNTQIELSVYNMYCSYMVHSNPHTCMNPWIQFIIMKIFMKIVQNCPKSPWFTVSAFWFFFLRIKQSKCMPWDHCFFKGFQIKSNFPFMNQQSNTERCQILVGNILDYEIIYN